MIKEVQFENNILNLKLQLTTANPDHKNQLTNDINSVISSNLDFVETVNIDFIGNATPQKQPENVQASKPQNLSGVKNIIAVASGKGGVGKSTIAVNLAAELSKNYKVGILDLDIYGPSLPMVTGINETPKITQQKKLIPIEISNENLHEFPVESPGGNVRVEAPGCNTKWNLLSDDIKNRRNKPGVKPRSFPWRCKVYQCEP